MNRLHLGALAVLTASTCLAAQPADAQSIRGFRVEAQTGYDQFSADGDHHGRIGFGGALGVDFNLGGGFVVGPEVTYWRSHNKVETADGPGVAEHWLKAEWTGALRIGYQIAPSTLVYGKVGRVDSKQRKRFTPFVTPTSGPGYDETYHVQGWQWGGGVNQMLRSNFYVSLEGRYSDYKAKLDSGGTHNIVGLVGLGFLFGGAEAAPPPPPPPPAPPPPPPPPATQTCPDGSVIEATATCPPPPPPAAASAAGRAWRARLSAATVSVRQGSAFGPAPFSRVISSEDWLGRQEPFLTGP
jgi:opacity protein-like surface antigen